MIKAALGECPVWGIAMQRLTFLDCRAGRLHDIDPLSGGGHDYKVPAAAGSFAPNADGRLVLALKEEIALLDRASGSLENIARIEDSHENLRLNDGAELLSLCNWRKRNIERS